MTNKDVVAAYSRIANQYSKEFFNELDSKPLDRKLYDLFAERIPVNGTCLEIGCGPGEVSTYLSKYPLKLIGVDKSVEMINNARLLGSGVEYLVDDVFNLSMKNESIDAIVAPFLIVNFSADEIRRAFCEMNRALKVNATILITFHIGRNRKLIIKDFFEKQNKIIFTLHRVEKINRLMHENGFKITETVIKHPYEGEETKRAFIYGIKEKTVV
jgi:ubiquinone/menaquinone biosynthesis C-methylase UbiE